MTDDSFCHGSGETYGGQDLRAADAHPIGFPQVSYPVSVISMCDDGPGIDPETLPHLFDRFYTGTDGRFGLGLPIAKSPVEPMGGSITAENGPGGGAVFTVTLKKTHEI